MAIILFFALLALIAFDQPIAHSLRVGEIGSKFYAPIVEYRNLRVDLAEWTGRLDPGNLKFFLEKARRLEWFIGFGVLLTYLIGAFFYPYFLIFLAGLGGLGKRIREDRRIQYLVALSFTALVMLYFHIIQTWVIADRFFAVFIFPASVFLGFGVQRIQDFLEHRFRLKTVSAGLLLCLAIITVALPKDLSPREADKIVFKQIGEFIAKREGNNSAISVATATNAIRWVSFYANLNYPGSPCPQPYMDFSELMGYNYEEFLQGLKRGKVRYFLWAERQWPQAGFDFIKCMRPGDFVEIGEWSHPDTGKMVLFSVPSNLE